MQLSNDEQEIITGFLKKATAKRRRDRKFRATGFPALFRLCSWKERVLLKKFLTLDPRAYGFRGECYGITPPPKELVLINKQQIPNRKRYMNAGMHYLPRKVFRAYGQMNDAMERDIGAKVYVLSGYRSPAYQLVVFLETLEEYRFDLKKTAKRVAFPGYSEHGAPRRQAIDFTTLALGEHGTDDPTFERTKEYEWLKKRAGEFGFHLSYPRGNKWGVMFEPWHWHFSAKVYGKDGQ